MVFFTEENKSGKSEYPLKFASHNNLFTKKNCYSKMEVIKHTYSTNR